MHVKEAALVGILAGFGCALVIFGVIFTIMWPEIFDNIFAKEMELTPESRGYEPWKQPPIELYLDIYMFNWTNPEDFKNHSIKPIFDQLGPYRFREKPDKIDIKFNPENSTVTYRRLSQFFFDEEGSSGSLDDIITSVNVVALSAAEKGRFSDYVKAKSISVGLSIYNQQIHVTKPARELLFEGYEDDMVSLAKQLPFLAGEEVPFDRVGWFYMRNNSADLTGWYNMHTGVSDISQIGALKHWNFRDTNGAFQSNCGLIHGSAGEFFPPKVSRHSTISIFTPDMCRSIPLDYEKDMEIEGITGYKFKGGARSVDNGTIYPENWCYAPGEGTYSGVLNISSCRFGTPVFMSYPHFYGADPYYLEEIEGMYPDEDLHQFYMTLEPTTGIAIDVAARLQLNLLINPNRHVGLYNDVPRKFMPILWFEQRVTISPELAEEIKTALNVPIIGQICAVVVIIIGLIMLLWCPIDRILKKRVGNTPNNKTMVKIVTVEELEKQGAAIEGSPLLDKKDIRLKNIEFKQSSQIKLNESQEKLPYIDSGVSSNSELNEKSGSISLLNKEIVSQDQEDSTKL